MLEPGDVRPADRCAECGEASGDFLAAHRAARPSFRSTGIGVAGRRRRLAIGWLRVIQARFSGAATEAASRADAIADGRYDLLGYRDVAWGAPPDWHRDPVNHARAPQTFWGTVPYLDPACGDHKVIWELNRHQHWLVLGRAYWLTGEDRYRAVFLAQLETGWRRTRRWTGINWASMLELASAASHGRGRSSSSATGPIATRRPGSSICSSRSIASSTTSRTTCRATSVRTRT